MSALAMMRGQVFKKEVTFTYIYILAYIYECVFHNLTTR